VDGGRERYRGFPPILGPRPRILILGSLPSRASIEAGMYYGHPRNLFWTLMGELVGAGPDLPYEKRARILEARGIALWDVARLASRKASADASMRDVVPNGIPRLCRERRSLRTIFFNGAKAEELFERFVRPRLDAESLRLPGIRLPSTSPANASIPLDAKRRAWRRILDHLDGDASRTTKAPRRSPRA